MTDRRPLTAPGLCRALAAVALTTVAALAPVSYASAQQAGQKAQPKGQQKGTAEQQNPQGEAHMVLTPWTKVCPKTQEGSSKRICFTGKEARIETGMLMAAAMLVEPEGEARKVLRITLPLGVALQMGTRVLIDQGQPMSAPYVICFATGCLSDYEATDDLIDRMRKGQNLNLHGFNGKGQPINLVLPLADFAKAHDGPPSEPPKQ